MTTKPEMTDKKMYSNLFNHYREVHGLTTADTPSAVAWAIRQGLLIPKPVNIEAREARKMARALHDDKGANPATGRSVRGFVSARQERDGHNLVEWGDTLTVSLEFFEGSMQQERNKIAGELSMVRRTIAFRADKRQDDGGPIAFQYSFLKDMLEDKVEDNPDGQNGDSDEDDDEEDGVP